MDLGLLESLLFWKLGTTQTSWSFNYERGMNARIYHYSIYQKNEENAIYLIMLHDCYSKIWLHLLDFFVLRWTKLVHQLWQLVHTSSVVIIKAVVQDVSDTLLGIVILPALTEMARTFLICVIKITWYQIFVFWFCQVTGLQSQFLCKKNWEKKVQGLLFVNINHPRQSFYIIIKMQLAYW